MFGGGLGDELFGGAVEVFCAPEQGGAGDAEPAQCLLDLAGFVDRLCFGKLPGRLACLGVTALRGANGREPGTLAIAAMTLVSRCGLTRGTRRAAAAMALLTGLAAGIFKYTWGTQTYGISERVLLGLGMCWISALAARAFIASTPDATAD